MMSNAETILIWAIGIEFGLVFLFVVFTYINRYYWKRVSKRNMEITRILKQEIFDSLKHDAANKLTFPKRIDLIIPIFQSLDKEFSDDVGKEAWISLRTQFSKEQLLPLARASIKSRRWLKHYYLCILLGYYSEPVDEAIILKLIHSKSIIVLINAVPVALKFGSAKILHAFILRLSVERTHVEGMLIAEAYQTPILLDVCFKILESAEDPFMRKTCFVVLDHVGCDHRFFDFAKKDIDSPVLELRLSAIRVLAKSDHYKALPILRSLLDSPVWQVREVSLRQLTPFADEDSFQKIVEMLHDPVWWVRYRAGMALLNYKEAGVKLLQGISESASNPYGADEARFILMGGYSPGSKL